MIRVRFGSLLLTAVLAGCGGNGIPPAQNYAVVTGRAYDVSNNQGVPGVTVNIDVVLNATSGADGTYRITNVPLGQCQIYSVTAPSDYKLQGALPTCGSVTAGQIVTVDIPLSHS